MSPHVEENTGISSRGQELPLAELEEAIQRASGQYYRLVIVAGVPSSGKTVALQSIAHKAGCQVVNVNLELSKKMLELTRSQRSRQVEPLLKNVIADLRLTSARAVATRLGSAAGPEGPLGPFDAGVARAFAAPEEWLTLAQAYVRPGGTILCLAGPRDELPEQVGKAARQETRELRLPFSGAVRRIGIYRVEGGAA